MQPLGVQTGAALAQGRHRDVTDPVEVLAAFGVMLLGLRLKKPLWLAVLFGSLVLITGSIWAEFAWGDWFPWGEPRVTSPTDEVITSALRYRVQAPLIAKEIGFKGVMAGPLVRSSYRAGRLWATAMKRWPIGWPASTARPTATHGP